MMATHTDTKMACSERIWRAGAWSSSQCSRAASVVRDGKHYCKQHDPEAVKAKADARTAAYNAEWAERRRVSRLNAAAPDLLALALQYRADVQLLPRPEDVTRRLAAIDAVIAKAKGE